MADDASTRLDHDQLFKRLLETFFEPTMRLLFPDAAARLRFDEVEFLQQDYFTDHPAGKKQVMDLVVQVGTNDEGPELILILGEIEYDRRTAFKAEMFDRFTLLRHRQTLPVFPVALYLTSGAHGRTVEEYQETVLGLDVLRFRFACVAFPDLNGIEYRQRDNPVAPAVAALMAHPGESRVEHKAHCLVELAEISATEAELALLLNVVDTYLPLTPQEQLEFTTMVQAEPFQEAGALISPFERRAEQRGVQIGEQRGEQRGATQMARDMLLRLLTRRFGAVPVTTEQRVQQADVAWCQEMADRAAVANSLGELGIV